MPMPPKDIKILVVDDTPMIRNIIKDILMKLGYNNIKDAENGIHALQKLREEKFDLVFLDWNMPGMQGIDVLREIRKTDVYKNTPVIMVTAEAEKEKVITAIKEGVSDYIVKPFKPSTLKDKIESIWK
ncbi:MAG: response regulator [Candidatus Calescibacterium sp.]|nr:response regulator [Candidatus Calescibacterium sp.]MCX7733929.1 response regulator [bacterium]MDW8086473.1 response regulator [Candidatus Calescibacterium sp.]